MKSNPFAAGACSSAMVSLAAALCSAQPARAQTIPELAARLHDLEAKLAGQSSDVAAQQGIIASQQRQIEDLREQLAITNILNNARGRGLAPSQQSGGQSGGQPTPIPTPQIAEDTASPPTETAPPPPPETPVGEAPPEPEPRLQAQVLAVPQEQGVLTQQGHLVLDPQIEYVNSANNRLVFRGIELIPGIQVGLIEASKAERDTLIGTMAFRYGVTNRLEAEVRIPFLSRNDRIEVVQQRDIGIVRELRLAEDNIGDIELNFRYQINKVKPLRPIWIAQLRIKSDTGKSPYEVGFDEFGVATGLATGSGFWGIQPGVSFLLPSDPVVIFGGASYLWNIPRNVGANIGEAAIGRVDPGDAISANLGFGFALNPRFSYSMGYRHAYITPTTSNIGDTVQRSNRLQVGQFNFGMSYRITQRRTLNVSVSFGVTEDAPDVNIAIRLPFDINVNGRR